MARGLTAFVRGWTRIVYGAADILLMPTPKLKHSLANVYRRKRIEVVGRGVEAEFFKPRNTDGPNLTALYVGRVSVEKDLEKLALFNFCMLSEIHRRHETISPWELPRIFVRYSINFLLRLKRSLKKKLGGFAPQLPAVLTRSSIAKLSKYREGHY